MRTMCGGTDLIDIQDDFREEFGWDIGEDRDVRDWLTTQIGQRHRSWNETSRLATLTELRDRVLSASKAGIAVIGAAASAEFVESAVRDGCSLILADGAFGVLSQLDFDSPFNLASKVICIVSDADGTPHILDDSISRHIVILHAHGHARDNLDRALQIWSELASPPRIIISHQTPEDIKGAINPGGFTDGDRALCLLDWLGVSKRDVRLVGFDGDGIGRWSGRTDESMKLVKLGWMRKITRVLGHEI